MMTMMDRWVMVMVMVVMMIQQILCHFANNLCSLLATRYGSLSSTCAQRYSHGEHSSLISLCLFLPIN